MSVGERAYEAAAAAAAGLLRRLPVREGKWGRGLAARQGLLQRLERWAAEGRDRERPLLWMHAPSVGEGLQAKAILERFRARHPDVQVFYTYFSPSAESWAARLPVDGADYLPFDRAADVGAALSALRPAALVFCKLDVWPVLTRVACEGGIPLGLVSATVALSSSRRRRLARWLLGAAYARLDRVGAIAEGDAERLVRLGVRRDRVLVTGDARFDQVWARARAIDRTGPLLAGLLDPARVTLVAGSTWPEDEKRLLPAFAAARRTLPALRLLLVPHEPEGRRVAGIEASLRALGLEARRHSRHAGGPWDALVVDRVGVLAELYAAGEIAYVGGGFGGRGIHSVLEPAAVGAPVLFGPRHRNAREAGELRAAGGGFAARSEGELAELLLALGRDAGRRAQARAAARVYVESQLGGAEKNAAVVAALLGRAP